MRERWMFLLLFLLLLLPCSSANPLRSKGVWGVRGCEGGRIWWDMVGWGGAWWGAGDGGRRVLGRGTGQRQRGISRGLRASGREAVTLVA